MIRIYNTLTRRKENLPPAGDGQISVYVCGSTVYDLCHIGHGRTFLIFDIIVRYLRYRGYRVDYARSITDIDDKIIQRARRDAEPLSHLTARMISEMHADLGGLHLLRPDREPRTTQHVAQMIELIHTLLRRRHAYVLPSGDVMFAVSSCGDYGLLSGQRVSELVSTDRIDARVTKRNRRDFVLWKIARENEPGWMSPWGLGRPGWHVGCTVMSGGRSTRPCDIHGGGIDLLFPHHENEHAQSVCASDRSCANVWVHVGTLTLDNRKMSKSSGNLCTIRDLLRRHDGEAVRHFLMSGHYRNPLAYSETAVACSGRALRRLYTVLRGRNSTSGALNLEFTERFVRAMDDDFNLPEACAVLFQVARSANAARDGQLAQDLTATLRHLANILGLLEQDPESFLRKRLPNLDPGDETRIEQLVEERSSARRRRDWKQADHIREQLADSGVRLEDHPDGSTSWR